MVLIMALIYQYLVRQKNLGGWELWCAGFRRSAGLHARVILDGAACRLRELGDVRDVLGVLGVVLVVLIVLLVLV